MRKAFRPNNWRQASEQRHRLAILPAQALLRRAAMLETRPPAKAALLAIALSAGGQGNRLTLTANCTATLQARSRRTSAMAGEGSVIARALVLGDHAGAAAAWYPGAGDNDAAQAFAFSSLLQAQRPSEQAEAQTALSALARTPHRNKIPALLRCSLSD